MTTVLLFGDSNTHGTAPMAALGDRVRFDAATRWPGHLARALPGVTVVEEGHPGRTTVHDDPIEGAHRNGAAVLPALLESHAPLDAVVIMLGTNDMKARFSVTAVDVALSVERLGRMVQASGCGPGQGAPRLLLVAPPPVEEVGCLAGMFAGGAAKSRRLAAELAPVAARLGAGFVDAGALIAVSPVDGVHYDAAAHARLAAALAPAVAALLDLQGGDDAERS